LLKLPISFSTEVKPQHNGFTRQIADIEQQSTKWTTFN